MPATTTAAVRSASEFPRACMLDGGAGPPARLPAAHQRSYLRKSSTLLVPTLSSPLTVDYACLHLPTSEQAD